MYPRKCRFLTKTFVENYIQSKPNESLGLDKSREIVLQSLSAKCPWGFSLKDNNLPIQGFDMNINSKEEATPVFHKAYTVPYALLEEVAPELVRLVTEGIISKLSYSSWASPVVIVPKSNSKLRLCVNFKTTSNKVLCFWK